MTKKIVQMFFVLIVVFVGFSFFTKPAEAVSTPVITTPLAPINASNKSAYTFYATGDPNQYLYFSVNDGQGTTLTFYDTVPTIDGTGHFSKTVDLSTLADSPTITFDAYSVNTGFSEASGHDTATTSKDATAPTVTSVDAGIGGGTYGIGTVVPVRVHFNEAVNVTGIPQLGMRISDVNNPVNYTGGDDTDILVFEYTVAPGDYTTLFNHLDYFNTSALSGTIKDGAGNNAVLTLASPGDVGSLGYATTINIDGIAPVVTTACIYVTGASGAGDVFKKGDFATPTWDNRVVCDNAGDTNNDIASVLFNAGDFQSTSNTMPGNGDFPGTGTYTAYTALDSQNDASNNITVTVTDNAGNATTVTGTNNYVINTIAPTATKLGDGSSVYSLPIMGPGYGADLVFSEELDLGSKTAVENALTAGTDVTLGYTWVGNTLEIRANDMPTFADNVFADITNLDGNTSAHQLLIQSTFASEVWVDDDYTAPGANDGHLWGFNAFSTIATGINAVTLGGTVHVAAGNYNENNEINRTLTLSGDIGDGAAGPGVNAPVVSNMGGSPIINVTASSVTIQGIKFNGNGANQPSVVVGTGISGTTISDNEFYNNSDGDGIDLSANSISSTINNNIIRGNDNGVFLNGSTDNIISSNDIHDNSVGININTGQNGGTAIKNNNIHDNDEGVYFKAGNQGSTVTLGGDKTHGNNIYNNTEGVYVNGNAGNFVIHSNSIHDNLPGLLVKNATFVDTANNWWGDASGPNVNENGPGTGEIITTANSPLVFYRRFCTNDTCSTFSSVETDPAGLTDHFTDGVFTIVGADYQHASSITVAENLTISVATSGGTSSVEIPAGTVISRSDLGLMNGGDLTATDIATGSLSGLGSGVTAEGALQWGIPGVTLEFNPAITLHIFVGTDKDGQTLNVKRSPDGLSGWTSDGIVAPATCLVGKNVTGVCDFYATKASTYASMTGGSSGTGGGSSGGYLPGYGPKVLALAPVVAVAPQIPPITPSTISSFLKNLAYRSRGEDVRNLQKYLNGHGFPVALSGLGSKGNETLVFGPKTKLALIKFQEANRDSILKPYGLKKGTGILGILTMKFINSHP